MARLLTTDSRHRQQLLIKPDNSSGPMPGTRRVAFRFHACAPIPTAMQGNDQAWRLDESRARSLIENASDMITVVAPDLTIIFQTNSGAEMLGYDAGELLGTKFAALVDPVGVSRLR